MKLLSLRNLPRSRRYLVGFLAFGLVLVLTSYGRLHLETANAQEGFNPNDAERMMSSNVVELREQLYFGLRTFRPEQRAFLDQVVAKVESKEISRAMVNVIFNWAQKRNPKVPYPYFEIALKLLAEKRGVTFS